MYAIEMLLEISNMFTITLHDVIILRDCICEKNFRETLLKIITFSVSIIRLTLFTFFV